MTSFIGILGLLALLNLIYASLTPKTLEYITGTSNPFLQETFLQLVQADTSFHFSPFNRCILPNWEARLKGVAVGVGPESIPRQDWIEASKIPIVRKFLQQYHMDKSIFDASFLVRTRKLIRDKHFSVLLETDLRRIVSEFAEGGCIDELIPLKSPKLSFALFTSGLEECELIDQSHKTIIKRTRAFLTGDLSGEELMSATSAKDLNEYLPQVEFSRLVQELIKDCGIVLNADRTKTASAWITPFLLLPELTNDILAEIGNVLGRKENSQFVEQVLRCFSFCIYDCTLCDFIAIKTTNNVEQILDFLIERGIVTSSLILKDLDFHLDYWIKKRDFYLPVMFEPKDSHCIFDKLGLEDIVVYPRLRHILELDLLSSMKRIAIIHYLISYRESTLRSLRVKEETFKELAYLVDVRNAAETRIIKSFLECSKDEWSLKVAKSAFEKPTFSVDANCSLGVLDALPRELIAFIVSHAPNMRSASKLLFNIQVRKCNDIEPEQVILVAFNIDYSEVPMVVSAITREIKDDQFILELQRYFGLDDTQWPPFDAIFNPISNIDAWGAMAADEYLDRCDFTNSLSARILRFLWTQVHRSGTKILACAGINNSIAARACIQLDYCTTLEQCERTLLLKMIIYATRHVAEDSRNVAIFYPAVRNAREKSRSIANWLCMLPLNACQELERIEFKLENLNNNICVLIKCLRGRQADASILNDVGRDLEPDLRLDLYRLFLKSLTFAQQIKCFEELRDSRMNELMLEMWKQMGEIDKRAVVIHLMASPDSNRQQLSKMLADLAEKHSKYSDLKYLLEDDRILDILTPDERQIALECLDKVFFGQQKC